MGRGVDDRGEVVLVGSGQRLVVPLVVASGIISRGYLSCNQKQVVYVPSLVFVILYDAGRPGSKIQKSFEVKTIFFSITVNSYQKDIFESCFGFSFHESWIHKEYI